MFILKITVCKYFYTAKLTVIKQKFKSCRKISDEKIKNFANTYSDEEKFRPRY